MKPSRLHILLTGVLLLAMMGCTENTQSQDKGTTQKAKKTAPAKAETVDPNGGQAHFEAGLRAVDANDMPQAFQEFLTAAQAGHLDSQFNVALMFEQGLGVSPNDKEALYWYEKSASMGNAAAQFNLGVLYENGRGTEIDFAKANKWYRKASVQGDGLAVGNLGMLYIRGDGVKENKVAGLALLLLSIDMDSSPENHARNNITATRGLTNAMVNEAQSLSDEMRNSPNMLEPLDRYLNESE